MAHCRFLLGHRVKGRSIGVRAAYAGHDCRAARSHRRSARRRTATSADSAVNAATTPNPGPLDPVAVAGVAVTLNSDSERFAFQVADRAVVESGAGPFADSAYPSGARTTNAR